MRFAPILGNHCCQTLSVAAIFNHLNSPDSCQDHYRSLQACNADHSVNWRWRPGCPRQSWLRTEKTDLHPLKLGTATHTRQSSMGATQVFVATATCKHVLERMQNSIRFILYPPNTNQAISYTLPHTTAYMFMSKWSIYLRAISSLQKVIQKSCASSAISAEWTSSRKIKTLVFRMMDGSNKRGRPHREWSDDIEQWCWATLQELRNAALNRQRWAAIVTMASDTNERWAHGCWWWWWWWISSQATSSVHQNKYLKYLH